MTEVGRGRAVAEATLPTLDWRPQESPLDCAPSLVDCNRMHSAEQHLVVRPTARAFPRRNICTTAEASTATNAER